MKNLCSFLTTLVILTLVFSSCTDEDKTFKPLEGDTELGGFVRFTNAVPVLIETTDPSVFSFSASIEDPNNNIVDYRLEVQDANGDFKLLFSTTTLPADVRFTSEDVATVLGVSTNDFVFGQVFKFLGTATNQRGITYSGTPINYDSKTGIISGGNSDPEELLNSSNNYRDAFDFSLTIACPTVDFSKFPGIYNVTRHRFDDFFGNQGPTREVILGPAEGQITIKGGALPLDGADDLILNIDKFSAVTFGGSASAVHFNTFGPGVYGQVKGLVFTCTGDIKIEIISPGFISNFLDLKKQ